MHTVISGSCPEIKLSKLDTLLAHLWSLLIKARGVQGNEEPVYLNFPLNFRPRMDPPLPDNLIGDPACMIYAKSTAKLAVEGSVMDLAKAIRSAIQSVNSETIPAFLHQQAHLIESQRCWQFFGGKHFVNVTAWLHHRMCEVDFGCNAPPRFVEPLMPGFMMQLMEARYEEEMTNEGLAESKSWYSSGVEISIHYETEVMERLINGSELRKYEKRE